MNESTWALARKVTSGAFGSSLHVAIGSIDANGAPVVTPIGSLFLDEIGHAHYFEFYATALGRRLSASPRVSILAVDSGKSLWLRALLRGRFARPPSLRLTGLAARETRESTESERARLTRRLGILRQLPGGRRVWGSFEAVRVRDIEVERIELVRLGPIPLWSGGAPPSPRPGQWP